MKTYGGIVNRPRLIYRSRIPLPFKQLALAISRKPKQVPSPGITTDTVRLAKIPVSLSQIPVRRSRASRHAMRYATGTRNSSEGVLMSILISHSSALERLRGVPPVVDRSTRVEDDVATSELSADMRLIRPLSSSLPGLPGLPLNVLIADGKGYFPSRDLRVHTTRLRSIPGGLLRELCAGVYAAGPELAFIQQANVLSPIGAIVLGHELCGTYSHFYKRASGYYDRACLTSTQQIKSAVRMLPGVHGVGKARRALRHVHDGSASPMETVMACMLTLPKSMGGFGCKGIKLNEEVQLDAVAQAMAGTRTSRVDAAFPEQRVGFEYDSLTHHTDPVADRRRREALAHMGWTIYTVDLDSITRYDALEEIVRLLEGTVLRVGELAAQDGSLSRELLGRLLRATRYRMGKNELLFSVDVPEGMVRVHL